MPKLLPICLLIAVALSGCVTGAIAPSPFVPGSNPRIAERDLSGMSSAPARAVASRPMPSAPQPVLAVVQDKPDQLSAPGAPVVIQPAAPVKAPATTMKVILGKPVTAPPKLYEVRASDVRLAATFDRWAKEAEANSGTSYKVLWDASKHVLISGTPSYSGSFLDAVEAALKTPAIQQSDYPLEACVYEQNPPLVRITRRGEQAEACPDFK